MTGKVIPGILGAVIVGASVAQAIRIAKTRNVGPSKGAAISGACQKEARRIHGAAALLSASVLADSALEHYRGSFKNPAMFAPLLSSALSLASGIEGSAVGGASMTALRRKAYLTAIGVGVIGSAFHVYNVFKRPGGLSWLNLFYGAPLGAPAALGVSGALGLCAESIGQGRSIPGARLLGLSSGRALAWLTSLALAGTVAEAALFHFRGAFQNPFMWGPVTLPPVASALLAQAAAERLAKQRHLFAHAWLWLTTALGFIGAGFHAYGVSRAMGGWRNWSQNLIDGPPLPAPPSFSALSLAGLSALKLIEEEARDDDPVSRL